MTKSHTKGPWRWNAAGELWGVDENGESAFILDTGAGGECSPRVGPLSLSDEDSIVSPDARLIETAPDLLRAIEMYLDKSVPLYVAIDAMKMAVELVRAGKC